MQLGEEECEERPSKNERKRINRFENSQYYILPLDDESNNQTNISNNDPLMDNHENQIVQNENNLNFNSKDFEHSNAKKG